MVWLQNVELNTAAIKMIFAASFIDGDHAIETLTKDVLIE